MCDARSQVMLTLESAAFCFRVSLFPPSFKQDPRLIFRCCSSGLYVTTCLAVIMRVMVPSEVIAPNRGHGIGVRTKNDNQIFVPRQGYPGAMKIPLRVYGRELPRVAAGHAFNRNG